MKTTLNEIRKYRPCEAGWIKLLQHLNKTQADDDDLLFKTILNILGIEDAIWCLRTKDYLDYCLFNADVAELALPRFEKTYANNNKLRKAIEGIRLYHSGDITKDELQVLSAAAAYVATDVVATYADAAAAYAAAYAAATDGTAAAYAAYAAVADATTTFNKIEELFIKHFVSAD